ncbi:MAG TPA: LysM peptidoglycan-binding domain-containing protein [Spirochaetota bacterium]|nr:LysM peptidoglycan-binding domain-containing protein [Spirochaetota bacterium]
MAIIILFCNIYTGLKQYRVRKGDSYYLIGKQFRINYRDLLRINKNKKLKAGDIIKIPSYFLYKVKPGDTLLGLSQKYKVAIKDIIKFNNGRKKLWAGKYIRIPVDAASLPEPADRSKKKTIPHPEFVWPVSGKIVNQYGKVNDIYNYGLILSLNNKKVRSSQKGVVVFVGKVRGMGLTVMIYHPRDFVSLYGGLEQTRLDKGRFVKSHALIGYGGPEIYFSIFHNGGSLNPVSFFN